MPYNPDPESWFPGMTSDGVSFTIPLTAVPGLGSSDVAVGSGAGGDFREMWMRLNEAVFNAYEGGNAPDQLLVAKQAQLTANSDSGTRTYISRFGVEADLTILPEV